MPELPEVEAYRLLAVGALRRPIASVTADDAWYLKGGLVAAGVVTALVGRRFVAARRIGKLLLLDTDGGRSPEPGPTLGLRFGMTGRLAVDGAAGVDRLLYASGRESPTFDRFAIAFADGGRLVMRDPRRLGGVSLDPDEEALGPDALEVTPARLRNALASGTPLKACLMDQGRLAGLGNLLTDEILWRAGLHPARPACSLTPVEVRRLHRHLRATVVDLMARGGSHTGDLMTERMPGGHCPRDATALCRTRIGGRTTWWCPTHQQEYEGTP